MKEITANISEEIESMMFAKDFSELNDYEKHTVSELMSECEYARLRAIIRSTRRYYAGKPEIGPAREIGGSLIKEFRKKHKKIKAANGFIALMGYPVPAYRAAAAMVAVIAALLYFGKGTETDNVFTNPNDTVYVTNTIPVPDTIYMTKEIIKTAGRNQNGPQRQDILLADTAMPAPDFYGSNTASVVEAVRTQKYGTAFSDDEKYMKFLTIAN